jgi:hypothetical protein
MFASVASPVREAKNLCRYSNLLSCRTGPLRGERPFHGYLLFPTNGRPTEGITRHEVPAPRAGGPSGRTVCGQVLRESSSD